MAQGGAQTDRRTDAELVEAARSTEPEAFGQLFDRWFDRSWNVARNIVRQDDIAAEVAQDAMLNAWQRLDQLRDVEAFGGWLLRITRNRALNRLERERRSRASGDEVVSGLRDQRLQLGRTDPTGAQTPPSTDAVVDMRDQQELVWAAAAALGERDASLLDLHLRHGLAPAEIAEELGVEANTAHQQLFRMRNKLGDAIGSYVLWRNGRPLCEGLAAAVSGQVAFDRSVSKAVTRHQKDCDQCSERRAALLDPSKLFASVPLIGVPLHLKVDAAAALQNAGVPIDANSISTGGRSLDDPPSEPPQADGQGSMPEPASSSPAPQPATNPVLADTATAYHNVSTGDVGSTLPSTAASSATLPARSVPPRALPSKALLGKAAIVGSATMLVGLIVLAVWQAGLLGLVGGDEVAAEGSETVAGPTISSETSDTATTPTEQTGITGTEAGPAAGADSTEGGSSEAGAGGNVPTGASDGPTATSSDTTGATSVTTRSADPTEADDGGSDTESTTATTRTDGTTRTTETTPTTTTSTTPTSTVSISTTSTTGRNEPTDPTTTTTDPEPTVSTTETTEVTTTEPPAPPMIVRFTSRASSQQLPCNYRTQRTYDAVWLADNTSSVQLSLPDGTTRTGKSKGISSFCGAPGQTIILVAFGPGGEDKAAATLG